METRKIIERAFTQYGLTERPDGDFESTRRVYRRADVLSACGVENQNERDIRMIALKEKGRRKA